MNECKFYSPSITRRRKVDASGNNNILMTAEQYFIIERKKETKKAKSCSILNMYIMKETENHQCEYDEKENMMTVPFETKEIRKKRQNKVQFNDIKDNEPLADIIIVESFKKYNAINTFTFSNTYKNNITSCCLIS